MFHSICLFVIVDYVMVATTQQDQVVIPVAFFWRLIGIEARAVRIPCLDVADFPDNFLAINEG
jgi:hypothetical protein